MTEVYTEDDKRKATEGVNNPIVAELLESNGISKESFVAGKRKKHLEMFMYNYPRMSGLQFFDGLSSLSIIQQDVEVIENLNRCTQLEKLWLCECRIKAIQGLDGCISLKELYLYSNNISKIQNLSNLKQLEVLWLNENRISVIEGLDSLRALRVLWLSKNHISQIGTSLDNNENLEELDLSCNNIGNFKDVPNLQRLARLRTVFFSNPIFGDNPICKLGNYQTFTLYHLPQISMLDACPVSEEARHLADATFVKKKMYYNMRIKTMKRNAAVVQRLVSQKRTQISSEISASLHSLLLEKAFRLKDYVELRGPAALGVFSAVENLDDLADVDGDPCEVKADDAESVAVFNTIVAGIRFRTRQLRDLDASIEFFKERVAEASSLNYHRLMVELESGGNVRLEEGRPKDIWFTSCVDLVRSRFFSSDYADPTLGVRGIRVSRVCRIHNRFLRNRFEGKLEQLVDTSDMSYKKSLEYLFVGENPADRNELLRFAEDGVDARSPEDDSIVLTNSVSLADFRRVSSRKFSRHKEFRLGSLLICKVYSGSKYGTEEVRFSNPYLASAGRPDRPFSSATFGLSPLSKSGDACSFCRIQSDDSKQKLWYLFDDSLVLPEYLVFFEYVVEGIPQTDGRPVPSVEDEQNRTSLDVFVSDVASLPSSSMPVSVTEQDSLDLCTYTSAYVHFTARCTEIALSPEAMGQQERIGPIVRHAESKRKSADSLDVDSSFILRFSSFLRVSTLAALTYLNLSACGLKRFDVVSDIPNLEILVLAFNELPKMDAFFGLKRLVHLDLSGNLLKRIEGLEGLSQLQNLLLQNNLIYRLEDVNILKRNIPDVIHLNLRGNAICDVKNYRSIILRRLVHLKSLDGLPVTSEERTSAGERPSSITWEVLIQHARTRGPLGWSFLGKIESPDSLLPVSHQAFASDAAAQDEDDGVSGNGPSQSLLSPTILDLSCLEKVQVLELPHMRIRKIVNLDRLIQLRRLNLCDNELSRIEGLETNLSLQELNLEENKLTKIEGLERCVRLRKLELGKNRIARIEGVSHLKDLTLLSIEDNDLLSLQGGQMLLSLMEFYAGNNKIVSSREVNILKDLPKLIILDLSGNQMCKADEDYRLYAIYCLRKLKVLDGVSIDGNESQRAKEMFAGRLSTETLVERLGHANFGQVLELNLSSCGIRDGLSMLEDFAALRELVLDGNLVSDIEPISKLRGLQVLRLSRNRIEMSNASYAAGRGHVGKYLEQLSALEVLDLSYNAISFIPGLHLHRLSRLKSLILSGNEIVKIEGLENLVQLRELYLDKNKIRQVDGSSFASLVNLRELRLEENALKQLDNFRPLSRLQSLHLSCNRIMELSELDKLVELRSLLEILLVFNPVARKPMYRPHLLRRVPSLQMIDGKEVTFDERERADALYSAQEYNAAVASAAQYGGPSSQMPIDRTAIQATQPPPQSGMYAALASGNNTYILPTGGGPGSLTSASAAGSKNVKLASMAPFEMAGMSSSNPASIIPAGVGTYRLQQSSNQRVGSAESSRPLEIQYAPPPAHQYATSNTQGNVLVVRRAKSNSRGTREGSFKKR
eukprot:ANDGO_08261.mRNA.1 Internalin-I